MFPAGEAGGAVADRTNSFGTGGFGVVGPFEEGGSGKSEYVGDGMVARRTEGWGHPRESSSSWTCER